MVERIITEILVLHFKEDTPELTEENLQEVVSALGLKFGLELEAGNLKGKDKQALQEDLYEKVIAAYEEKERVLGEEATRNLERMVFLQIIDSKWKDHLYAMDKLREGIGLRAYGHRDPLIEYKNEAFNYFSAMIANIEEEALEMIFKLQPARPERFKGVFSSGAQEFLHPEVARPQGEHQGMQPEESPQAKPREERAPVKLNHPKVGRNDPCPCGSGKKYKKCCGK
jgi:preprotein translocase subunit SecA